MGNTNSLKAEGFTLLLKVTPSDTPTLILSACRSHLGYTLLNPCQVSHPLAGDTLVPLKARSAAPPRPPLPPALAARQQDQVAAEAALCRAARQPLPQEGWAAHLKVTAGTRRGLRGAGLGACRVLPHCH